MKIANTKKPFTNLVCICKTRRVNKRDSFCSEHALIGFDDFMADYKASIYCNRDDLHLL